MRLSIVNLPPFIAMRKAPTKMTGSRAFLVLERAMKERLLARNFGTDERMSALQYFKEIGVTGCIYCNRDAPERWDHLIPIRDGGATVLGNMVPACQQCDDSKSSKHYLNWLDGNAKRNPAKNRPEVRAIVEARVVAYQERFGFVPPADFLSGLGEETLAMFAEFQKTLEEFRSKLERFGLFACKHDECEIDDE
jgi:hypothetical protein